MSALFDVNIISVIAATAVYVGIGFAWYSEMMFGPVWRKLMEIRKVSAKKMSMGPMFALMPLAALIMGYVMAKVIGMAAATTVAGGAMIGGLMWLGFVATTMINNVIFGGRPFKVYLIDSGYQCVGMVVMGAMLALWR